MTQYEIVSALHEVVNRFPIEDRNDAAQSYVHYWVSSGKLDAMDASDVLRRWRLEALHSPTLSGGDSGFSQR